MPAQPEAATPALAVDGIFAGYGGGDVLRGVSMRVVPGGITCVVGPNGAGKSTLLRAVSGLLRPRQGQITLHGEPIVGKSPREILKLGVVQVPQNHSLFREMTVRENINLGAYILTDRKLAERRLDGVLEMFPQVTPWLGQKAGSLSGGPHLLVEQNARAGLRLSTHGVVLENGQVRLSGSGKEVLEHPEIGALYLGGAVTGDGAANGSGPDGEDGTRGGSLILDVHCHVIVEDMTARTVPPDWRPVIGREDGRYRLAFRGRDIGSVAGEFTDVDTMLGQAAATGVDRLLLSPWISLVPAEA